MYFRFLLLTVWIYSSLAANPILWSQTQRLEDAQRGQVHYLFGEVIALSNEFLAVGSVSSNMAKGHVRVYFNPGDGYVEHARLTDPEGMTVDDFGCSLAFDLNGTSIIVGAQHRQERGGAFVFQSSGQRGLTKWSSGVSLIPDWPMEKNERWQYGINLFGRSVALYGNLAAVGSSIYRPRQSAINVPGTKEFIEILGEAQQPAIPNDYVVTFYRNTRGLWKQQDLVSAKTSNSRENFGRTITLTESHMVVGASSRIRIVNNSMGGGFGLHGVAGWIHVFQFNGSDWYEVQEIRPESAYFIGHSLATTKDGLWMAFGSEWWDRPDNASKILHYNQWDAERPDSVFIYQLNETNLYEFYQVLEAPSNASRFGYSISISNDTLVIGAPGSDDLTNNTVTGMVFIYQFVGSWWTLVQVLEDPATLNKWNPPNNKTDWFGAGVGVYDNDMVVTTRSTYLDKQDINPYLSSGAAYSYKYTPRPISPSQTTIVCQYTTQTAEAPNVCIIHARDNLGLPSGQSWDASDFSVSFSSTTSNPNPVQLEFVATGEYRFTYSALTPSTSASIAVKWRGTSIKNSPMSIIVKDGINPIISNVTCNDVLSAGFTAVCVIHTFGKTSGDPAGEIDAMAHFDVQIYNVDLPDFWKVVPSPLKRDGTGLYSFTFTPPTHGLHAVLVRYLDQPIGVPNPFFVDATIPDVDPSKSTVDCPSILGITKNSSCVITLRGSQGAALAGDEFDIPLINVNIMNNGVPIPLLELKWIETGKVKIIFMIFEEGNIDIDATYNSMAISKTFSQPVPVAKTVRKCSKIPMAAKTIPTFIGHFRERNNETILYNEFSNTNVQQYVDTICEDIIV